MGRDRAALARLVALLVVVVPAAVASGCMGDDEPEPAAATGEAEPRATTEAEEEQEQVVPPSDFVGEPAPSSVALSWVAPGFGAPVERYGVYRDGAEIAELDGGETSYTDRQVVPGSVYWYEIESRAAGLVSDRAFSEVTVPLPPLRAARLAGVFNVRTKVESSSGYSDLSSASFGWRFRPRCGQGACDVRWSDLQTKTIRATLARRGTRYRGSYRGFFYVQCGSARATSAVELDVRVTAARVLGSEWRVTRFEGTVAQSEAEQLGCVASEARMSIRGRVAR